MSMAKTKQKNNLMFETFVNKYLTIILRFTVERTIQRQSEVELLKTPMHVNGYLIDHDETYLFIGHNPDNYDQAINKIDIVHIELSKDDSDPFDEILKDIEGPKDEKGYN